MREGSRENFKPLIESQDSVKSTNLKEKTTCLTKRTSKKQTCNYIRTGKKMTLIKDCLIWENYQLQMIIKNQ